MQVRLKYLDSEAGKTRNEIDSLVKERNAWREDIIKLNFEQIDMQKKSET